MLYACDIGFTNNKGSKLGGFGKFCGEINPTFGAALLILVLDTNTVGESDTTGFIVDTVTVTTGASLVNPVDSIEVATVVVVET